VGVFRDEHSGKSDKRPGFQAMLNQVYAGEVDAIVAHHLDRFSRNLHQILTYFKELESMGVVMAFAKDQFDFSTEEGRLQFHILAVFADWYLRNLSRETKKGKLARVLKGLHNNQPPIGYRVGPDGVAQPVPEEAEMIRKAYELYASGGYTDSRIADFLNGQGLRTRTGRAWSKDAVRELLQNEFYIGWVKYRGDLYPGKHEGIITQELFEQVQAQRRRRATHARSLGATKRTFLLAGVIRCDLCGQTLWAQGNPQGRYSYYRETSHLRGFSCPHARKSARMDIAHAQIDVIMAHFSLPDVWREQIMEELLASDVHTQIVQEQERLTRKLRRIGELYADGVYDQERYRTEREKLQKQLEQLTPPRPVSVLEAGAQIETLAGIWPQASDEEKQELCRLMFSDVYLNVAEKRITRIRPQDDFRMLFRYHAFLEEDERGDYRVTLPPDVIQAGRT
jgi:DNA invertase Pin-like site-specific DNA recombinase